MMTRSQVRDGVRRVRIPDDVGETEEGERQAQGGHELRDHRCLRQPPHDQHVQQQPEQRGKNEDGQEQREHFR
jgi:hypothetical protein